MISPCYIFAPQVGRLGRSSPKDAVTGTDRPLSVCKFEPNPFNCLGEDAFRTVRQTNSQVNDNNNNQDNVYGAVIMAEPLREFTRFI